MSRITLQNMLQVEKQRDADEQPHPHSDYTVIWVQAAVSGWHDIDFIHYPLAPPQLFFLKPQQVHFLQVQGPQGYVLQFSQDYLCSLGISDHYLDSLGLFVDLPEAPLLPLTPAQTAELSPILEGLQAELDTPLRPLQDDMAATWLRLFLLTCARFKQRVNSPPVPILAEEHQLVRRFQELVQVHYQREHKVAFYAEQLMLSPDALNQKLRGLTQKTAKEHIQEQIMLNAKRAAYFSQESAKQVAYRLGFDDPAHFSKFFKNCAGESFSAFRARIREKYNH